MAARRKGPKDPGGPGDVAAATRAYAVALEEIGSQFRGFGEALAMQGEKTREGFARVDERFSRVDQELGLVKVAVLENTRDIKDLKGDVRELKTAVARLDAKLDKKVDREEVAAIVEQIVAR